MILLTLISIPAAVAAYYLGIFIERQRWKHEEHRIYRGVPAKLVKDAKGNYEWKTF